MTELLAGFGRADITPKIGCQLVGYAGRSSGATGVHDPLFSRALVLENPDGRWALISNDLCYLNAETIREIRESIYRRVGIPPSHTFVAATHTHSGPHDRHAHNWDRPLAELVANAVETACQALQPARIGSGFGFLYGYSINRRWLDRPIDPGIAVLRVDDAAGRPLGLVTNFGCHAVVLGYDNYLISADWPGYACAKLEQALGTGAICLFFQGGAGDVNPLVEGVRKHLRSGHTVIAGDLSAYYGSLDDPQRWNIYDRGGGTFEEAAELGEAFADEVLRVATRISTMTLADSIWSEQVTINAAADPDEPRPEPPAWSRALITEAPTIANPSDIPAEVMVFSLDGMVLIGEPGEPFSQTAVNFKVRSRALGYTTPVLAGYANGWLVYLPEPEAFDEGGYEPGWAVRLGISRHFQMRVWEAIEPILRQRAMRKG
ncbi:MAG: neutral/alkaline non-lysosomal ceramidase N-terminal domain-containing protein [Anaerolineae bacterium]|nr:neutral/alkaline non-lysosomal ceramidase N-terminal domain-containing protein [Anaerolineae bacterium]MDW8100138.1 neutral/alkaline non-lysosomal ceramidase N-terminal domain-containing protein [Anaerolineae bacterium]